MRRRLWVRWGLLPRQAEDFASWFCENAAPQGCLLGLGPPPAGVPTLGMPFPLSASNSPQTVIGNGARLYHSVTVGKGAQATGGPPGAPDAGPCPVPEPHAAANIHPEKGKKRPRPLCPDRRGFLLT